MPEVAPVEDSSAPSVVDRTDPQSFAQHFFGVDADKVGVEDGDVEENDEVEGELPEGFEAPEADEETDAEPDAKAPEPDVKLPFTVKDAEGKDVVASSVQGMTVTLKANGRVETLALADVVRRAQSEPGAQQQAREYRSRATDLEAELETERQTVANVRALALAMVNDDDELLRVRQEMQDWNEPEARAERAEQELAADRQARIDGEAKAKQAAITTSFFEGAVIPAISALLDKYPSVSDDELWGRFDRGTSALRGANGVIPPEHYGELETYLAGPFAEFVQARHAENDERAQAVQKSERKAQLASQRMKNEAAGKAKPTGGVPDLRVVPNSTKPTTYKEAQAQGLNVLMAGLTN